MGVCSDRLPGAHAILNGLQEIWRASGPIAQPGAGGEARIPGVGGVEVEDHPRPGELERQQRTVPCRAALLRHAALVGTHRAKVDDPGADEIDVERAIAIQPIRPARLTSQVVICACAGAGIEIRAATAAVALRNDFTNDPPIDMRRSSVEGRRMPRIFLPLQRKRMPKDLPTYRGIKDFNVRRHGLRRQMVLVNRTASLAVQQQ